MKFGKSAAEAEAEPSRGGGDGQSFMKYLKAGDNQIRVLDEPDKWVYYWEHYNPGGYPFPCTNERDTCPGCTSDDEKMSKASRKIAFNAFDGEYTNVWKVPKTVADKLKMRYERLGTVTDRDWLITQFKKDNGFFDYDVEGMDKEKIEINEDYLRDPEDLLAQAYEDAWGDSAKVKETSAKVKQTTKEESLEQELARERRTAIQRSEPKAEPEPEKVVTEEELRAMEPWDLVELCKKEGFGEVPKEHAETSNTIVDWMLNQ